MIKRILRLWTRVRRGRRGRPSQAATPPARAEPTTDSPPAAPRPPRTRDDSRFTDLGLTDEITATARPISELEPALEDIAEQIQRIKVARQSEDAAQGLSRRYDKSPDSYLRVVNLWADAYSLLTAAWVDEAGRARRLQDSYIDQLVLRIACLPGKFSIFPQDRALQLDKLVKLWVEEGMQTPDTNRARVAYEVAARIIQRASLTGLSTTALPEVIYGYVTLWSRFDGNFGKIPGPVATWLIGEMAKWVAGTDVPSREIPREALLAIAVKYGDSAEAADELYRLRKGSTAPKGT